MELLLKKQLLKDQFVVSERFDFDLWDTKIMFDYQNMLFCMSKNFDKTVFEGNQLKSFTVKEDSTPLFEGSEEAIKCYVSTIPESAMALAPRIIHFLMKRHMRLAMDKMDNGTDNRTIPMESFDVLEPFQGFNVELHFNHPYWSVIKFHIEGPRFSKEQPNVKDYISSYQRSIGEIEKLVVALKTVAFPNAPGQSISRLK